MYLHNRFREANQTGDMCVDFENLYNELDQYLTDGRYPVGTMSNLPEPVQEEAADVPMIPTWNPDAIMAEGADIGELALNYVRLHGRDATPMWFRAAEEPVAEEDEEEMESPRTRDEIYRNSTMDEVSNPDHWATLHYGDREPQDHDRMVAFSQANQMRLERTISILEDGRDQAEAAGSWYAYSTSNSRGAIFQRHSLNAGMDGQRWAVVSNLCTRQCQRRDSPSELDLRINVAAMGTKFIAVAQMAW